MPEPDAFEGAYGRLAATCVTPSVPKPTSAVLAAEDAASVRWAASRLLPRLTALAPKRRLRRARPIDD